jgi:hypothetical protein
LSNPLPVAFVNLGGNRLWHHACFARPRSDVELLEADPRVLGAFVAFRE